MSLMIVIMSVVYTSCGLIKVRIGVQPGADLCVAGSWMRKVLFFPLRGSVSVFIKNRGTHHVVLWFPHSLRHRLLGCSEDALSSFQRSLSDDRGGIS